MTIAGLYEVLLNSNGICTDSREVIPGSIYFALKGETFNGNDFATEAVRKGCLLAVVDSPDVQDGEKFLRVDSALDTLQDLATHHRKVEDIRLLAITGSNGKTTTKELIAAVLGKKFSVMYTSGNLNNHIGVPLTLLKIKEEEFGIIEMGANHAGEIARLADITAPDFGLITNIGKAHLEGFGSLEGVLQAKGELYQYLSKNGKKAFLNHSNELLRNKARSMDLDCIIYNDERIHGRILDVYPRLKCEIFIESKWYPLSSQLVGAYNLENIIAAVAVGNYFGVPVYDIISAIETYKPEIKRSQLIQGKKNTIILDAYNANPTSMKKSISDFIAYTNGPKMAILGDMFELGKEEAKEHFELIKWLHHQSLENILFVGKAFENAGNKYPGYKYFTNSDACSTYLKDSQPKGYTILIKGSRKIALESTTIHLID